MAVPAGPPTLTYPLLYGGDCAEADDFARPADFPESRFRPGNGDYDDEGSNVRDAHSTAKWSPLSNRCQNLRNFRVAGGIRRHEAVELDFGHIQQREEHWAIVDLKGNAEDTRTIPMPAWVEHVVDQWLLAANISAGKVFRRVHKTGKAWGE